MIRMGYIFQKPFNDIMSLLYDNLVPITFRIGFLNCSFKKARETFVRWKTQHFKSVEFKEVSLPIEQALGELQPLSAIPRRWLLVPTASDWVAYFDNGARGPDPVPIIGYLAEQLACQGAIATSIPNTLTEPTRTMSGLYGAVQFELFAPHPTHFLNYERIVSSTNDGGKWRFDANGPVQSFEDTARYQKRRVVDRFTPDMLKSYCYALGIRIDSPDFYRSPSVLVSTSDPLQTSLMALSLAQVQQQMGLVISKV